MSDSTSSQRGPATVSLADEEGVKRIIVNVHYLADQVETHLASRSGVDVIISDMHRPGDERAGYTLLESLRARGDQTPYVIYTSTCDDAEMIEASSRGALGCATRISEIMQTVLSALEARKAS